MRNVEIDNQPRNVQQHVHHCADVTIRGGGALLTPVHNPQTGLSEGFTDVPAAPGNSPLWRSASEGIGNGFAALFHAVLNAQDSTAWA